VHDAGGVRARERLGHLADDLEHLRQGRLRALLARREIFALEPLHRDEGRALREAVPVGVGVGLVERAVREHAHDARVGERREHLAFLQEALLIGRVVGRLDQLERARLAGLLVERAEHDAGRAPPDLFQDLEALREELSLERSHLLSNLQRG
jgi:hypothetical protein